MSPTTITFTDRQLAVAVFVIKLKKLLSSVSLTVSQTWYWSSSRNIHLTNNIAWRVGAGRCPGQYHRRADRTKCEVCVHPICRENHWWKASCYSKQAQEFVARLSRV